MKKKSSSVKTSSEQRFVFKSRKAERKTMRRMKKQKKGRVQQAIINEVRVSKVNTKTKKLPVNANTSDWRVVDRNKEKVEENKLKNQFEKCRREQMLRANEDEDKEIKRLAKHLKLDKKKTIGKSFVDDGLDCILFFKKNIFTWFA